MGQTFDCLCKGIKFTYSHRPEEAIADSYDKCKPGLKLKLHSLNQIKVGTIRLEAKLSMKTCHEKLLELEFFSKCIASLNQL